MLTVFLLNPIVIIRLFVCLFSEGEQYQSVAMQPHKHAARLPGRHSEVGSPAPLRARGHTPR